ncbi:uncharacterized protein [Diadema setosum]|uniref:uncharacterized protein n=1 Tax=Diadema setosum TaxID=31175 RepID=UPI003B3A074F
MSGKRLLIGVLCTVCVTLGLYLKFFNHESAEDLLAANRMEQKAQPIEAKPRFHHFKAHKVIASAEDENQGVNVGKDDLINTIKERTTKEPAKAESDKIKQMVDVGDDADADVNAIKEEDNGEVENAAQANKQSVGAADQEEKVPIVDVEKEDGDDEKLRDAGGNGGERTEDGDGEVEAGEGDGVRHNGRGRHGIKFFDWDKWVKDNDFVELGNIWAYCDDEDPPVVGKVLLLPDEDNGGLKNVIIFNTTLEYDVVMGKAEVSIEYNKMHFYGNTFDFGDLETEGDFFKCPIAKGDQYYVREQHLSALVPKGTFYGEARLIDQNDKVILCSSMTMTMK